MGCAVLLLAVSPGPAFTQGQPDPVMVRMRMAQVRTAPADPTDVMRRRSEVEGLSHLARMAGRNAPGFGAAGQLADRIESHLRTHAPGLAAPFNSADEMLLTDTWLRNLLEIPLAMTTRSPLATLPVLEPEHLARFAALPRVEPSSVRARVAMAREVQLAAAAIRPAPSWASLVPQAVSFDPETPTPMSVTALESFRSALGRVSAARPPATSPPAPSPPAPSSLAPSPLAPSPLVIDPRTPSRPLTSPPRDDFPGPLVVGGLVALATVLALLIATHHRRSPAPRTASAARSPVREPAAARVRPSRRVPAPEPAPGPAPPPSEPPTAPTGIAHLHTVIPPRYADVRPVGSGAMGVVYHATDRDLQRSVAIKVLAPEKVRDPEARQRFLREARTLATLNHPSILAVYDVGRGEVPYLVTEFLDGQDLHQALEQQGPLPLAQALGIGRDILAGLGYAHSRGVIHRDLKPANVFLSSDGRTRLVDFGLARCDDHTPVTATGMVVGTFVYIAPEVLEDRPASIRSDLYSFGVTLFETLTGRLPFPSGAILTGSRVAPAIPSVVRREIPAWLDQLVVGCLAWDPEQRPASADEVLAEMAHAGDPLTIDEGFALLRSLNDLHANVLHRLTNALGKAERFGEDLEGFRQSFFAPRFVRGLVDALEGEQGLLPRLDRMAVRWLSQPERVPPRLRVLARVLARTVEARPVLASCAAFLGRVDPEPAADPADPAALRALQSSIREQRAHLLHVSSRLREALEWLHLPVRTLLSPLVAAHPAGAVRVDLAPEEMALVALDPVLEGRELEATLEQLVENAFQAGARTVRVRPSLSEDSTQVHIEIEDDGHGMPEAQRGIAFRRAFTTKPGGTGTGLMQAARVVTSMQGSIAAHEPGHGVGLLLRLTFPASF